MSDPAASVSQLFRERILPLLQERPRLLSDQVSCRFIVGGAGRWELGAAPMKSEAEIAPDDFLQLWQSLGKELHEFVRDRRLRLDGDQRHAIEVTAMLARAHSSGIDGPSMAFRVCPGRFHFVDLAFMRGTRKALLAKFPGYLEEPGGASAWFQPYDPPLPFIRFVPSGLWWEGLFELYVHVTSDFEAHERMLRAGEGMRIDRMFPDALHGGDDLHILRVRKEFAERAAIFGDVDARALAEYWSREAPSPDLIPLHRQEYESAFRALREFAREANEANERLWFWARD